MAEHDTALAPTEAGALVEVPDTRLHPTTRRNEVGTVIGVYFLCLIPTMVIGNGLQLVVLAGLFAYVIRRRRNWYRSIARQREVQRALAADDIATAARVGRQLLVSGSRLTLAHALGVALWGVIELRRGRPQEAVTLLERVLASGRFSGRAGRVMEAWRTVGALAYAHAIIGDLDAAQRRLAEADAALSDTARGALFTIRTYVMCRNEEHEAVIKLFDAQWRSAEPQLTVGGARTARLLEAFSLEHTTAGDYRSGVSERRDRALDRAREGSLGAYDYLAVHWPEFGDFLLRHRLTVAQP